MGIQLNPDFSSQIDSINNAVPNAMSRTFYVNAVEGSDANDGSLTAPFATISKAVDSVPVGGYGVIYLKSDYELNENINIDNKIIYIKLGGFTFTVNSYTDNLYNYYYYGFRLRKASIRLENGTITLSSKFDSLYDWVNNALGSFLKGNHPGGVNFISIGNCTINLPSDGGCFCTTGIGAWAILTHLLFESCTIIRDGGFIYNVQASDGVGSFTVHLTSLKDSAGNTLAWTDVISGIVRDANGVPRNIISNKVL